MHAALSAWLLLGLVASASVPEPPVVPEQTANAVVEETKPPPSAFDLAQAESARSAPAPSPAEGSIVTDVVRMMLSLAVVVALVYLVLKVLLPRYLRIRHPGVGDTVRVLERVPLDPRQSLLLVSVKDRGTLLLATGERGVQLLASFDGPPPEERHERS